MLFLELHGCFLKVIGCSHSAVPDPCRVKPRVVNEDLGVGIGFAPLLWCRHEDDRCHRCGSAVNDGGDFLTCGTESVIYCPAFQHVTSVAVDMHVDGLVLGWYGIAELVDVTERDARFHAPHAGHGLLLLALDVVVDVKYCHSCRNFSLQN